MDREAKQQQLEALRDQARRLEDELEANWPPRDFYASYHILGGMVLGMFGAIVSLLANVIGSLLVGQHPLHLIQVYLTFPLGEAAFDPAHLRNEGLVLSIGCCLYIGTGMVLGIPFHLVLTRYFSRASFSTRFAVASGLALLLWLINFYGILSWLQPVLYGGNWIVRLVPWWVGALTHLAFGWTMLVLQPWGEFAAYRHPTEA